MWTLEMYHVIQSLLNILFYYFVEYFVFTKLPHHHHPASQAQTDIAWLVLLTIPCSRQPSAPQVYTCMCDVVANMHLGHPKV